MIQGSADLVDRLLGRSRIQGFQTEPDALPSNALQIVTTASTQTVVWRFRSLSMEFPAYHAARLCLTDRQRARRSVFRSPARSDDEAYWQGNTARRSDAARDRKTRVWSQAIRQAEPSRVQSHRSFSVPFARIVEERESTLCGSADGPKLRKAAVNNWTCPAGHFVPLGISVLGHNLSRWEFWAANASPFVAS